MPQQVLIAGAGPVGLFAGLALRRLGLSVRIIDHAAAPHTTSRALVLWPRSLELFDIHGCVAPFLAAGHQVTQAHISAGRERLVNFSLVVPGTRYPFALFLPQCETERLLAEALAAHGTQVEYGTELRGFSHDADGVTATLHGPNGEETLRTDWLLGCDGAHSIVRTVLALPFKGATEPSDWMLGDLTLEGAPADAVLVSWHQDGALALFPMGGGRWRVVADRGGKSAASAPPTPDLAEIQGVLDRRGPGGLVARDPRWLAGFRINERKVERYRVGRVMLAGDAAHIHSPVGGQGMNTGLQDVGNLAWKLAMVASGQASDCLLDSYTTERTRIGDQVLRNATAMTHVAVLRNPLGQAARNQAARLFGQTGLVRRRMALAMTQLDLHYHGSPINAPAVGAGLQPGDRAPDIVLDGPFVDGHAPRLADALRDGKLLVVTAGTLPPPRHLPPFARAVRPANLDNPYALDRHTLVRPDGYIAGVVNSLPALGAALGRITGA
jgi:2-polyprenyl-6-methoxyphenol hydroxylase-like FAD-dependent oxidoreductase